MEGPDLDRDRPGNLFAPLVITGSDQRLQSEYGTRDNSLLRISGIFDHGRRILYGPHISLPPGHFRFELFFEVEARGAGMVTVDLTKAGGHRDFYMRRCFEWELQRGLIRISHFLFQPIERFELRLYAGIGFAMVVKKLAVCRLGETK